MEARHAAREAELLAEEGALDKLIQTQRGTTKAPEESVAEALAAIAAENEAVEAETATAEFVVRGESERAAEEVTENLTKDDILEVLMPKEEQFIALAAYRDLSDELKTEFRLEVKHQVENLQFSGDLEQALEAFLSNRNRFSNDPAKRLVTEIVTPCHKMLRKDLS